MSCTECGVVSTDPTLMPMEAQIGGGAKKAKAPKAPKEKKPKEKKPKAPKEKAPKEKAPKEKKTKKSGGGTILGELGQLAIPLGLIAAKEGVEYLNRKRKTAKTAKKAPTSKTIRRASFGGNPYALPMMSNPLPAAAAEVMEVPVEASKASDVPHASQEIQASQASQASAMPVAEHATLPATDAVLLGGAQRSEVIAREFRKMAGEINEFLRKRKAEAKKPAAKPSKPAAKKPTKKGGAECAKKSC